MPPGQGTCCLVSAAGPAGIVRGVSEPKAGLAMAVLLMDEDIARLLAESKPLPADFRKRIVSKAKRGHKESDLVIHGEGGSEFRLTVRQASANVLDFSVVLAYRIPRSNQLFRLRRYNSSHQHTNVLEGETFDDFHIHLATARYQDSGLREDAYAQPSDRYGDVNAAIECMVADCAFRPPPNENLTLF